MANKKISDLAAVTNVLTTDEYVLARSATTKKITGADLAIAFAGAGGAMTQIYDSTLGSPGSFDVSSIAGTYIHLKLVLSGAATAASLGVMAPVRFNNDSGSNYDVQWLQTYSTTSAPQESLGATSLATTVELPGTTAPANSSGHMEMLIANYAATVFHKTASWTGAARLNTGTTGMRNILGGGLWRSTAAINRIQVFAATGSLATGTRLTIYGLL